MNIKKNCSKQEKINELQVGEFFEHEGELYIVTTSSLSEVYSYNFSKDKIFRFPFFCFQSDDIIIVNVVDKHHIEITYSL